MRRWHLILLIALMTGTHSAADGVLTIVAPAAPGGGWDQTARVLQQVFARVEPATRVQVENVPGAAGTIGLARFVSAERGNPNALLVTGLVMVSGILTTRAPVTLTDVIPIARLTGEYEAIVVPSTARWQTMRQLVESFRAVPEGVVWGGGSAGGTDDLLVRLIAAAAGVPPARANYIAFPGGGAALAAVLGGQVTVGVSGYAEFAGQVASGALRVLAISAPSRVPQIDAPTLRDAGLDVELANWRGLVAPPGISDAEHEALTTRIETVARSAEWKTALARNEWADLLLTRAAFRQFLLAEQQRIAEVLRGFETVAAPGGRAWRPTPMTLPVVALLGSIVLVILVVWQRAASSAGIDTAEGEPRSRRPAEPHAALRADNRAHVGGGPHTPTARHARARRIAPLVASLFVYALLMPALGFVPLSAALFVSAARSFGSRRPARDGVVGIVASTTLYLAFTLGLGVDLPPDPLTGWLTR